MVRSHSWRKDKAVYVLCDSIVFRDFYRGYKKACVPFLSLYSSASREKIPPFCSAGICKVSKTAPLIRILTGRLLRETRRRLNQLWAHASQIKQSEMIGPNLPVCSRAQYVLKDKLQNAM